jgi:hypothetical protein
MDIDDSAANDEADDPDMRVMDMGRKEHPAELATN